MFLTESQSRARLSSPDNLANRFGKNKTEKVSNVTEISIHRPNSAATLSNEKVAEIAIRARSGVEYDKDIAEDLGVSRNAVTGIKNGKTPASRAVQIDSVLSEVRDRALERLMSSMGLITDDKLSGCSAKDLSVIASNMSRVVERTIPNEGNSGPQVNVVIYSPEPRQEKYYKSVEI